ncbi:TPA: Ig domain-containing protein [Salmonella enterica subsp. enterica serovar Java]
MKLAEAGTTQPPVWQSSSPSVATVDNQGVVTLWGPGRTEIEVRDPQSGGYDRWPLLVSGWVSQGAEGWAGNKAPDTVCPPESTLLDRGRWDALDAQWGTDLQTAIMGHHPAIRVQGTITENTTSEEAPLLRIRDGQELPAKGRAVAACLRMVVPPVLTGWSVGNFQWPIAQGGPRNGFRGARFRLRLAEPPGGLTWRSDKPEVASVDDIGQVTLHQLGETVIRAGNAAGEASLALAVQTWWSALPVRPEGYTWDEAAQQCQAQGGTLPTLAQLIGEKADRAPVPASWWGEWPSVRAAADDLDLLWSATSRSRTSGAHAVVRLRDGTTGEMSDNLRAGGWCVMPSPPRKAP